VPFTFHFYGLAGALWAVVASRLLCIPVIIYYSNELEFFDLRKELLLLPYFVLGVGIGKLIAAVI
jgi:hypothetical protein